MLSKEKQGKMRDAMQEFVEGALETDMGECIAVDKENDEEYSHKWRDGEACVCYCDEDDEFQEEFECFFRIRVELVAVQKLPSC